METDEDLLTRSIREPAAFELLVVRHSGALHGYLSRRAPGAADDLLAEVWLRAFASRGTYDVDRGTSRAPAGPRLRAALYEVLAGIPHVRLAGSVKDSAGRQGTAIELKMGYGSSRVIIEPRTSRLLEAISVLRASPGGEAGTVRRTYLSAGPAENAPTPRTQSGESTANPSPQPKG
ncbi:hypothetical protein ACFRCX_17270 [Streptomyces sp. NPDC056652]|uniref:hypothetical protein n=1 Tax=Streptomyces sp. NPDC056652 TaxID=3345893 RepID=UPI0036A0DCA1